MNWPLIREGVKKLIFLGLCSKSVFCIVDTGSCFPLQIATWSVRAADAPTLPSKSSRKSLLSHFCWKSEPFKGCLSRVSKCQQSFSGTSTWSDSLPPHIITCERQSFTSNRCKISSLKLVTRKRRKYLFPGISGYHSCSQFRKHGRLLVWFDVIWWWHVMPVAMT